MKRFFFLIIVLAAAANAQVSSNEISTPVAPIAAIPYRGFTNAIPMQNEFLRAVIVPQIGRLMEIELLDSESPLRADAMLDKGKSSDTNTWANYGGSWVWLAPQNLWPEHFGRGWPPPLFDSPSADWTASAWKRADGSSFCRLQMNVGAPMHVRVTREFLLPRKSAKLEITQRIDRILESKVPVTIWNVAQVGKADEVVLPLDPQSSLVQISTNPIPQSDVLACSNTVVISVKNIDENKVGSTSPRSWVAGRRGLLVLLVIAKPGDAKGSYPEGECRTEMYTSKGLGYTELETLSEQRLLSPGETLSNTVTMELFRAPAPISGCAFAMWAQQLVGEIPFPADASGSNSPGPLKP